MGRAGLILWGIVGAPALVAPHVVEFTTYPATQKLDHATRLVLNGGMTYYKQEQCRSITTTTTTTTTAQQLLHPSIHIFILWHRNQTEIV